ncbi:hypothetical protein [Ralstonia pickettii]|uniref:hypothetical protein n=1 Tax=Ralstonia pickettii TaxID=329 RepID=UPI000A88D5BB|nr:hypothetical protein [Ralstonia pickettii]
MLSARQFAVLLLLTDNAEPCELDRANGEALVERQLTRFEGREPDHRYAPVSPLEDASLEASDPIHAQDRKVSSTAH